MTVVERIPIHFLKTIWIDHEVGPAMHLTLSSIRNPEFLNGHKTRKGSSGFCII
jgi:hypothetical protein